VASASPTLKEVIKELLTAKDNAGRSERYTGVMKIVRGQRAISADTALRLSRYFGTRPEWWLDLQTHHDLEVARDHLEVRISRTVQPRVERQAE